LPRPLLVHVAGHGAAGVVLISCVAILFLLLTKDGGGTINGRQVTAEQLLTRRLPVLISTCLVGFALAYAIWRDRPWSRHLVLGTLLAGIIAAPFLSQHAGRAINAMVIAVVYSGLALWYFYVKRNVVAYYDDLKRRRRQDTRKVGSA